MSQIANISVYQHIDLIVYKYGEDWTLISRLWDKINSSKSANESINSLIKHFKCDIKKPKALINTILVFKSLVLNCQNFNNIFIQQKLIDIFGEILCENSMYPIIIQQYLAHTINNLISELDRIECVESLIHFHEKFIVDKFDLTEINIEALLKYKEEEEPCYEIITEPEINQNVEITPGKDIFSDIQIVTVNTRVFKKLLTSENEHGQVVLDKNEYELLMSLQITNKKMSNRLQMIIPYCSDDSLTFNLIEINDQLVLLLSLFDEKVKSGLIKKKKFISENQVEFESEDKIDSIPNISPPIEHTSLNESSVKGISFSKQKIYLCYADFQSGDFVSRKKEKDNLISLDELSDAYRVDPDERPVEDKFNILSLYDETRKDSVISDKHETVYKKNSENELSFPYIESETTENVNDYRQIDLDNINVSISASEKDNNKNESDDYINVEKKKENKE
ncbi:hypothetical protein A3Q56_02761 [Intoshia linei]|uniref:Uncharacterized protein n=1 Tax=Intoshia linei TaxID=1819745 RepID=A0A177B769_9BILA|nr:hypothetical protein A3Q56_02761 [Intoshia linei]